MLYSAAMKISPRVPLWRFAIGVAVILAWSAATIWAGATLGPVAAVLAGVLFTVPLCSLGEWLVHGVLYHNELPGLGWIRDIHHKGHHFALFPPKKYVQESGYPFMHMRPPAQPWRMSDNAVDSWITEWAQIALHFAAGIPLILLPAWYGTKSAFFFVSALATLSFISWLLAYVHGVIHTPGNRWIERQAWFCWLDRHHYTHHVDITANMNFMLPICDLLFGTQKPALTEAESSKFPSFEEAKPMAKDIAPAPVVPVPVPETEEDLVGSRG